MAKAKRKERDDDGQGPSRFFIIVLILGIVVFVWLFLHFMPEPATGDKQGRSGFVEECLTTQGALTPVEYGDIQGCRISSCTG